MNGNRSICGGQDTHHALTPGDNLLSINLMCMVLDWGGNWRAHAGKDHADAAAPAVLWLVQGCFYHHTAAFCYCLWCELNTLGETDTDPNPGFSNITSQSMSRIEMLTNKSEYTSNLAKNCNKKQIWIKDALTMSHLTCFGCLGMFIFKITHHKWAFVRVQTCFSPLVLKAAIPPPQTHTHPP